MIRSSVQSSGSYEPVDAADFDDQSDDTHYRGPRPSAYQHLRDENEEDEDHVSYNRQSPSWANVETSRHELPKPQYGKPLMRSVSREGSALSHPTPDLQSIQGAYTGNVSRLEESAERLSLSSDIGEELRKLNLEQKRAGSRRSSVKGAASRQFSSSSHTNSIIGLNSVARSGGFSHEGYVTSPLSSIRSPTWSQMDHASEQDTIAREPLQEGKPLDSPISVRSNILTVRNQERDDSLTEAIEEHGQYSEYVEHGALQEHDDTGLDEAALQRNASTATKNTYQQAEHAFADFDGVHIPSEVASPIHEEFQGEIEAAFEGHTQDPVDRGMSFSPTFSESLQTYTRHPDPGESGMVFYPAPVPMMLNLPQKLSKNVSTAKMAQRRSQFVLPRRKSMASLGEMMEGDEPAEQMASPAQEKPLPPQLRATMYFDQPSVSPNIQVKGGSAVATLESILDASAHAPVSAFTDHPLVGHVGPEVYGKAPEVRKPAPRLSRSSTDLLTPAIPVQESSRRSFLGFGRKNKGQSTQLSTVNAVKESDAAEIEGEHSPLQHDSEEGSLERQIREEDGHYEEELRQDRPTTLLAELQVRKAEQQKRGRTAATAYPEGMRSTLLQLDAVAQIQKQSRKQKQVTLAWEDPAAAEEPEPDETEDVPLGMLFPTSKLKPNDPAGRFEEDRPLGLLAKRQMEESEPLSARRARLRGDPVPVRNEVRKSMLRTPSPFSPGLPEENKEREDEEGETLAQRRLRLAVKDAIPTTRPVSGDFTSELLSQFGPLEEKKAAPPQSETPDPEETLGQRRKRLQAEAAQRQVSGASGASGGDEAASAARKRRSMADLLQAHPVGQPATTGSATGRGLLGNVEAHRRSLISPQSNRRNSNPRAPSRNLNLAPGFYMPNQMPHGHGMGLAGQQQGRRKMGSYVNPMTYTPMMGMNGGMHAVPAYQHMGAIGQGDHIPLNTKQRDVIDRWRQSVL